MEVRLVAAVLGLALAGTATAATPTKPQRFTSFIRSDKAAPSTYPINAPTGATLFVATDASEGDFFLAALSTEAKAKLDAFRFEHRFLVGVVLTTRTNGYSVTIKRIALQRVTRSLRQFCVTAAIAKPAPGKAVVNHLWLAMQAVSLSADPYRVDEFHWNIPKTWVLRDTRGKLLDVSVGGTNRQGKPIKTGNAKLCSA